MEELRGGGEGSSIEPYNGIPLFRIIYNRTLDRRTVVAASIIYNFLTPDLRMVPLCSCENIIILCVWYLSFPQSFLATAW